jgi:hypothetical protein
MNPSYKIKMHYKYPPENNMWWEKTKEYCTHVPCDFKDSFMGNKLPGVEFQTSLLRLELLLKEGGIYLDSDTLCLKPFDSFLNHPMVMGIELADGKIAGLCDAVILAEPNARFLQLWIDSYRDFNPEWAYMQIIRPCQLAFRSIGTNHIWIEPHTTFFKYSWTETGMKNLFGEVNPIEDSYALHMWCRLSYQKYLKNLTEAEILGKDTTYNIAARRFLDKP